MSTMTAPAAAEAPDAEKATGGGKKKKILLIVLVLALVGGAAWFFLLRPSGEVEAEAVGEGHAGLLTETEREVTERWRVNTLSVFPSFRP